MSSLQNMRAYWRYTLPLLMRDWRTRGTRAMLSDFLQMKDIKWGELVGVDSNGNRYFTNPAASLGHRRFVLYPSRTRFDPASVPPVWNGWLHETYDELPNEMNVREYPWQLPPVHRLDHLSQSGYQAEFIPKGAYVRRTGILHAEEHPRTVAATKRDPHQLKPRISVVQVNSTVTPLTEEPDAETNPWWEREPKKRMLAHPNPIETFCPTGEHGDPHAVKRDDPNDLAWVARDKQPFHGVIYQPWKPIPYVNADQPFQPVEVGQRPNGTAQVPTGG